VGVGDGQVNLAILVEIKWHNYGDDMGCYEAL